MKSKFTINMLSLVAFPKFIKIYVTLIFRDSPSPSGALSSQKTSASIFEFIDELKKRFPARTPQETLLDNQQNSKMG